MNLVLTRATFPSSTCTPPNGVFYQLDNDSGDVDMFAVKRKSRAQIRPPPYRRKKRARIVPGLYKVVVSLLSLNHTRL